MGKLKVYHTNQDWEAGHGQVTSYVLARSRAAAARAIGVTDGRLKDWGGILGDDHKDAVACIRAGEGVVLFRPCKGAWDQPMRVKATGEVWTPYMQAPEGGAVDITAHAVNTTEHPDSILLTRRVWNADGDVIARDFRAVSIHDLAVTFWPDAFLGGGE